MRKGLVTALAASTLGLASGGAMAVDCVTIATIGAWQAAGTCDHGDKQFTFTDTDLDDSVTTFWFPQIPANAHGMQIAGFDNSDAAGSWFIDYTITVSPLAPTWFINQMFAGADNPGGGSRLDKAVTGDDTFDLFVDNGLELAGSFNLAVNDARTLNIHETFSVDANSDLASVSNTYRQREVFQTPEPGTLALMGVAIAGLALIRRRRY